MSKKNITKKNNTLSDYSVLKPRISKFALWVSIVALVVFAALTIFTNPVADDFTRLWQVRTFGLFGYIREHLLYYDGRYSNALILGFLYVFFGTKAITLFPIALLILGFLSLRFLYKNLFFSNRNNLLSITALSLAGLVLISASIIDTIYWTNAASIYTISIIGSIFILGYVLNIVNKPKVTYLNYLLLILICLFVFGFNEIIGLFTLLYVAVIMFFKNYSQRSILSTLTVFVGFVISFTIEYFAPGTMTRRKHLANEESFTSALSSSYHSIGNFLLINKLTILICLGLSTIIAFLIYENIPNKVRVKLAVISSVMFIVVYAFSVFTANYTGAVRYDDSLPPLRGQNFILISLVIATTTVTAFLFAKINKKIVSILVVCGLIAFTSASFVKMAALAESMVVHNFFDKQRKLIIDRQLRLKNDTLYLPSNPYYFSPSEASDISNDPTFFSNKAMSQYYGVKRVETDNNQTLGYCPYKQVDWYINGAYCIKKLSP